MNNFAIVAYRSLRNCFGAVRCHIQPLIALSWPILLSQIVILCSGIADTIMVGHMGAMQLAAISLGGSLWMTTYAALYGLLQGAAPLISRNFGSESVTGANEINGLMRALSILAIIIGMPVMLLLMHGPEIIYKIIGAPADVATLSTSYVGIVALGLPAILMVRVFFVFTTSIGLPKPLMYVNIIGLLIKIFFNYIFIYGYFGFPQLGLLGCAWGTVIMSWSMLCLCALYLLCDTRYQPYLHSASNNLYYSEKIKSILAMGIPIGLSQGIEIGALALLALIVAPFGSQVSAAHQILVSLTSILFMFPLSLGIGGQTLIAHARGAGAEIKAWNLSLASMTCSVVCGLLLSGLFYTMSPCLLGIFTDDVHLIAIVKFVLPVFLIYHFFDGIQCVVASVLRGWEQTLVPTTIYLFALWGIGVAGSWFVAISAESQRDHGIMALAAVLRGVWGASAFALLVCAVGLSVFLWGHVKNRGGLSDPLPPPHHKGEASC